MFSIIYQIKTQLRIGLSPYFSRPQCFGDKNFNTCMNCRLNLSLKRSQRYENYNIVNALWIAVQQWLSPGKRTSMELLESPPPLELNNNNDQKPILDHGLKLVFAVGTTECLPEVPNQNLETQRWSLTLT